MHPNNNILAIHDSRGTSFVEIDNIVRVEAVGNYSKLLLVDGRTMLVARVLKHFEAMLAVKGFVRIHRSHLVNAHCIKGYNSIRMKVILTSQEEISISRRRSFGFLKKLAGQNIIWAKKVSRESQVSGSASILPPAPVLWPARQWEFLN